MNYPYQFDGFPNPFINKRERDDDPDNKTENIENTKKNNISFKINEKSNPNVKLIRPFENKDLEPDSKRIKF